MDLHPAAALFPALSGAEYEALKADIAKNGQQDPIYIHEHRLLDGRNRLKACHELEIEPQIKDWDGECGTPEAFIASKNLFRRHLSESQRAIIAAKLANGDLRHQSQALNGEEKTEKPRLTDTQVAQIAKVSRRSVTRAKKVLKKGTPEEIKAVEEGKKTVSEVARQLDLQPRADRRGPRAPKKRQLTPPQPQPITAYDLSDRIRELLVGIAYLPPPLGLIDVVRKSEGAGAVEDALPKAIEWLRDFAQGWNQAWETAKQ